MNKWMNHSFLKSKLRDKKKNGKDYSSQWRIFKIQNSLQSKPSGTLSSSYSFVPLDRNGSRGTQRWEQGLVQIPLPPREILSKTSWAAGSLPFFLSSLTLWESASQLESSLFYKLMHTLPPLFWFLDICFSNSFSAAVMPVTASLLPPPTPLISPSSPPPGKPCHSLMSADIPQWRRQSSGPVPYLRTQTQGHRKCWSLSTILWANHSKFPNLLIKKTIWETSFSPLPPSSKSRALKATLGNWIASD